MGHAFEINPARGAALFLGIEQRMAEARSAFWIRQQAMALAFSSKGKHRT